MFGKCATFQSRTFPAIYGDEHLKTRLKAVQGLIGVRENRPKVFQIDFLVDVWNRMNYDFVDACMEGVRRIMRISPTGSKRDKIARLAWRPRADGTPLWKFPDTFSLGAESGFWQSIILPELERAMESQMITHALGKSKAETDHESRKGVRAGGGKPAYPTGKRLRANEQDAARKNAPVSKSTGKPL